jgi:hypothetical protein
MLLRSFCFLSKRREGVRGWSERYKLCQRLAPVSRVCLTKDLIHSFIHLEVDDSDTRFVLSIVQGTDRQMTSAKVLKVSANESRSRVPST